MGAVRPIRLGAGGEAGRTLKTSLIRIHYVAAHIHIIDERIPGNWAIALADVEEASRGSAQASVPPAPVSGVFEIAGKTVPLPEGEWSLIAEHTTPAAESAALVAVQSGVLVRLDAGEVRAVIVVHTNAEPLARSLPAPPECRRGDIYLAQLLYETKTEGACLWANYMLGGSPVGGADPVWRGAAALLARPLPSTWLVAGFWIGDRQDGFEVRCPFPAAVRGA